MPTLKPSFYLTTPISEADRDKELFLNSPISAKVNPNILVKDKFNTTQTDYLYLYDQMSDEELGKYDAEYLKARGIPFSTEMEHLLNTERRKIKPVFPTTVPETITNSPEWIDYLQKNSDDPSFVATKDPEEVRKIMGITAEAFDMESIKRNASLPINERRGYNSLLAWDLFTYKNQKELGDAGVNPYEGASAFQRFKSAFLPRQQDADDVNKMYEDTVLNSTPVVYDDLGYRVPKAEHLFPGRPDGQKGPVITYERDKDGLLVQTLPFNAPGFSPSDLLQHVGKEIPSLIGEIAVLKKIRTGRLAKVRYFTTPGQSVIDFGKEAAAMGFGAAAGDFVKLAGGELAYDGFQDPEFFQQAFMESSLIGAYATAGNAAAITLMNGAVGTWSFLTGKPPADFLIKRMVDLRNDYQKGMKARGIEEGSEEAAALFDEIIGASPSEVKKLMEEMTDNVYTIFQGEGQIGGDANFALGMLRIMKDKGFSANRTVEILENQLFNNQKSRLMFAQDLLLNSKSLEAAKQSAAELADSLGPKGKDIIDQTFMKELEDAWEIYGSAAELGTSDMKYLISLGLNPEDWGITISNLERRKITGLNEVIDELPGELGDDVSVSRYAFEKITDPNAQLTMYNEPTLARLRIIQQNFLKESSDNINTLVGDKYGGLSTTLNYRSPLALEIRSILSDSGDNFVKDKAMKDWFYKDSGVSKVNGSTKSKLLQLQGQGEAGKFGGATITFRELHDLSNKLKKLKNNTSGKANAPAAQTINDLLSAIERQQELMFNGAAKQLKNSDETISAFRERTNFGSDYFGSIAQYREKAVVANNISIKNLLKRGEVNPESMINAMFSSTEGGATYHVVADPLFKMLREDTSGEGFNLILKLQSGIGARYKAVVVEPFKNKKPRDYKGMKEAHEKFMNENGGLLKSAFATDDITKGQLNLNRFDLWDNVNATMNFVEEVTTKRDKVLARITDEFEPFMSGGMDPDQIILSIVRGDQLLNSSGGIKLRNTLAKIVNSSGDRELKNQLNSVVRADIYNQIIDVGVDGRKTINPEKLNSLLTSNYVSTGPKGDEIGVSFNKMYGMFLEPKEIRNLQFLNAGVQQQKRIDTLNTEIVGGALRLADFEKMDVPTLGRLIFGPLNPYTYRFGWRERALEVSTNDLLARAIQDPLLLDKLMRQINKKTNIKDTIRFLYSLDTVQSNDMARNLEGLKEEQSFDDTSFQSDASDSPFRSEEYLFYLQEFMKTTNNKNLNPKPGVIPAGLRTGLQQAPITVPAAIGTTLNVGVSGVADYFSGAGVQ